MDIGAPSAYGKKPADQPMYVEARNVCQESYSMATP